MVNVIGPSHAGTVNAKILCLLRRQDAPLSGEALSRELGISRVAVWKHIRTLRETGYGIESGRKGYLLDRSDDFLFPWEFPGRESLIIHSFVSGSTMDLAAAYAADGCPERSVIVAETQSRGRGRLGREWNSAPGGLYVTIVLRPGVPAADGIRYSFAASAALCTVLTTRYRAEVSIEWPADIVAGGRKLGGILTEIRGETGAIGYLGVGIGLNVNNDPGTPGAVSLSGLLGRCVPRREVLSGFLDAFEMLLPRVREPETLRVFRNLCSTIGREVRIDRPDGTIRGIARDIDERGALVVETPDHALIRVESGTLHRKTSQTT